MNCPIVFLAFLVSGGGTLTLVNAANILGIFPFPGPSQYIFVQPYFKELAARGHEVTLISAFPHKQPVKNFRDISVADIIKKNKELIAGVQLVGSKWAEMSFMTEFGKVVTQNVLDNREVQQLLQSEAQHFDVVIIETLLNEPLFGFAEHFGAHLIGVSSCGTMPPIDDLVGNTSPISYIPHLKLGLSERMTFAQRLQNLYVYTWEFVHHHLVHLPLQQSLYRQYFPRARHSLHDVCRNFSLMLLNQHFSLSFARPYVPNMIEVGGMHLKRQPDVLPPDMQRFLDESADQGVVYFSMGSNLRSTDLPPEKLALIMRTLGSLKQRVMWKFEQPDVPGKPANVYISKWFPQPDILAHPSVRLFITHGGLLSTIEAIYHGKPVLGLPVFYDQFLNVERAKAAGFGLGASLEQLTEPEFRAKIDELLTQPKYSERAQLMSRRYRDQPLAPLETAIFWTEYVLRHEGAQHMRVAARHLSLLQYWSLDTATVLFGGAALAALAVAWLLLKLLALGVAWGRRDTDAAKEKRQ